MTLLLFHLEIKCDIRVLHVLYTGCQQRLWSEMSRWKVSPHFKWFNLKKNSLTGVWILVNSRCTWQSRIAITNQRSVFPKWLGLLNTFKKLVTGHLHFLLWKLIISRFVDLCPWCLFLKIFCQFWEMLSKLCISQSLGVTNCDEVYHEQENLVESISWYRRSKDICSSFLEVYASSFNWFILL